jgi:hypothetical protein
MLFLVLGLFGWVLWFEACGLMLLAVAVVVRVVARKAGL